MCRVPRPVMCLLCCLFMSYRFRMIFMYFPQVNKAPARSLDACLGEGVAASMPWRQACRPLHFSSVTAHSVTEYSKLAQLGPITFLHRWAVAIATALPAIGYGQSLTATKPVCKWRPPGPPFKRSLVTDPRQTSAVSVRRRPFLLL